MGWLLGLRYPSRPDHCSDGLRQARAWQVERTACENGRALVAQTIDLAPWRIPRSQVESERVRAVVYLMKENRVRPKHFSRAGGPSSQPELFRMISRVQE